MKVNILWIFLLIVSCSDDSSDSVDSTTAETDTTSDEGCPPPEGDAYLTPPSGGPGGGSGNCPPPGGGPGQSARNIEPVDGVHDQITVSLSNSQRVFTTYFWPTYDNFWPYTFDNNPNTPSPYDSPQTFSVPETPSYPTNTNTYNYFSNKYGASSEVSWTDSIDEVPAQFWPIGLVGRPSNTLNTKTHWASDNLPLEILPLEPLPAACGGVQDSSGSLEWDGASTDMSSDVLTDTGCDISFDTNYVSVSGNSFTKDSTSGTYEKPGYYFRYYLPGVQGKIDGLEMDVFGGHTQPDGTWHVHLTTQFENGYEDTVIGYGFDGTPIMGLGSSAFDIDGNDLGLAKSRWERRTEYVEAPVSQDGLGAYHYDYIYNSESSTGNVDEFNGAYSCLKQSAADTENCVITYVYFLTEDYPQFPRNIRGAVTEVNEN